MSDKMSFGGEWTEIKLDLVESYFDAYNQALKNKPFTRVYIDAFAGCGNIIIKGKLINGSTFRSLKCSNRFDRYLFIDKDKDNCDKLNKMIEDSFHELREAVTIIEGDSNELIKRVNEFGFSKMTHRGVIFLDPFALELEWASLEAIANMEFLDVWYLFPIDSMLRCLPKIRRDQRITDKITKLLGTEEWFTNLYKDEPTLPIFDEEAFIRDRWQEVVKYVIKRLSILFGKDGVAHNPKPLLDEKNHPRFLLCFAVSNKSIQARKVALRIATHLLSK